MSKKQAFPQRIIQRVWQAAGTKYALVLVGAVVWMLFFDRYSLQSKQKVQAQIEAKQHDVAHYNEKIQALDYQQYLLENDADAVERLAREKYYMKKANEDVFPVVTE